MSFPLHFLAQLVPPNVPCITGVPGCVLGMAGAANMIADNTVPIVAHFLIRLAGAASVAGIILGGIQLIVSAGDDTKISHARWAIVYSLLGLTLAVTSQMIVSFVASEEYGQNVANRNDLVVTGIVGSFIRIAIGGTATTSLVNVLLAMMLFYYGVKMFYAQGKSDEFNRARTGVLWTIVGAVVINLARSLVWIVTSFFGI